MMKKIVRLTESDLTRIVKRVIKESSSSFNNYMEEIELISKKLNFVRNCEQMNELADDLQYIQNEYSEDDSLSDQEFDDLNDKYYFLYDVIEESLDFCNENDNELYDKVDVDDPQSLVGFSPDELDKHFENSTNITDFRKNITQAKQMKKNNYN